MRVVDLFAGCGGLSLGFQNAGYTIVAAFDNWDKSNACYSRNFSHQIFKLDLSNPDNASEAISVFKPDMIIGGPPCQDFSHAGKRVEGQRANLTISFADIVAKIKPKWFVMENVARVAKSSSYALARCIFKGAGYGLTEVILDASLCGVPQKRKRFFCIGAQEENDNFIKSLIEARQSKVPMTIRQYMGDKLGIEYYYRHPRNYNRRAVFSIDEPAPTVRGVNRPVPSGYRGHNNDATIIDQHLRPLTTEERALIQTFPESYSWLGSKTDTEQMIGNAVPVKLAEFVAICINKYIEADSINAVIDYDAFLNWLQTEKKLGERSSLDVVSRIKRANRIKEIDLNLSPLYVFELSQTEEFSNLSIYIKSQIRRAISLLKEYMEQRLTQI